MRFNLSLRYGGYFLLTLFLSSVAGAEGAGSNLMGLWRYESTGAVVKVTLSEGKYHGVVIENPNRESSVGNKILQNFVFDEKQHRWTGIIYAERLNTELSAVGELINDQTLDVTVKQMFMSKTIRFSRISSEESEVILESEE